MPIPSIKWSKIISGSCLPFPGRRIHGRAIHGVAARRIAAVRPVHHSVGKIEFQVDGFGQILVEQFNVSAVRRSLPLWNFEIGAEDASLAGIVRALLSPIKLSGCDVERDPHTPFRRVLARDVRRPGWCRRGFDLGAIQIAPHDPHAFAIAPVELAVLLVELELLGSEGAAEEEQCG